MRPFRVSFSCYYAEAQVSQPLCSTQGTPADVLYKGTITRLITEDSASRIERERDEVLSKGHVVYEGISGHILTYDRKYNIHCFVFFSFWMKVRQTEWFLSNIFSVFVLCRFIVSDPKRRGPRLGSAWGNSRSEASLWCHGRRNL